MSLEHLKAKIKDRSARLGMIGLGYVGLPVACVFAKAGFTVHGIDIKADRVNLINAGQSPIEGDEPGLADLLGEVTSGGCLQASTDYQHLREADVVLIAVDTPVDQNHQPQYTALRAACSALGRVISRNTLVIIESTVAPGTVHEVVQPTLEAESGLQAGVNFFLGTCPERVMPGRLLRNLREVSRVCGGQTPEVAETMRRLYRHVVQADIDVADIVTAEVVKTAENAYRDVQIAFANEVAMICEVKGANVWRVRELVNKSPQRNMHLPGAGVGGHCIPKDPWLLAFAANHKVPLQLIPAARAVNEGMPLHVADLVVKALSEAGQIITQTKVGLLGYAYLENSDDTRHSPTASLVARLHRLVSDVVIHDPYVEQYQGEVLRRLRGCDAVVLMVKHEAYRDLDFAALREVMRTPVLVDSRGFFEAEAVQTAGFTYWGLGWGKANQL